MLLVLLSPVSNPSLYFIFPIFFLKLMFTFLLKINKYYVLSSINKKNSLFLYNFLLLALNNYITELFLLALLLFFKPDFF